jgi:hypothetical protein
VVRSASARWREHWRQMRLDRSLLVAQSEIMFAVLAAAAVLSAPVPAMNYDWFSGIYDWPNKGIGKNELVNIGVDVTVNPYGYMQSCTSHVRSGLPALGPYVCSRLGARAEFDAARDANGRRVYGIYRTSVILWSGEGKDAPRDIDTSDFKISSKTAVSNPDRRQFVIQFAVDALGRPSACSLVPTVGYGLNRTKQQVDSAFVEQACSELPSKMHAEPARDRSGRVVPSVQTAAVRVTSSN